MVQIRDAYVQYLIVSPLNQTQTYMGEHHMGLSHDQVNRFMRGQKLRPRHVYPYRMKSGISLGMER